MGLLHDIRNRSNVLLNARILTGMNTVERLAFLGLCNRRTFKAGETIYYQGDPGTGLYIIEEGVVELIVESVRHDETDEHPTYRLEAPESFGALSIGYEMRRMSTARCVTDTVLYGFFKPDLDTLAKRYPKVGVKFLYTLNMIALKQLQVTVNSLVKHAGEYTALGLQFETYFHGHPGEET